MKTSQQFIVDVINQRGINMTMIKLLYCKIELINKDLDTYTCKIPELWYLCILTLFF